MVNMMPAPAAATPKPAFMALPNDQDSSGRTLGAEEILLLSEAIESGTLTSTKGKFVKTLETQFAEKLGVGYAYACSSGSAAIHTAVAAINPCPGDEIITTSITDMGALSSILYQSAVPRFADVDPRTWNVTAETIAPCITPRTKAIIVTHLFGNPCQMEPIMALARAHGIPVIEDAAQAFMATQNGQPVGTLGDIGCFSLQQGKHITTGEGGLVVTNNSVMARKMWLFINKAWGYGDKKPDHYFLAPNYRMTELQGAVACAQLPKLDGVVAQRQAGANQLTAKLQGLAGVEPPFHHPGDTHVYWKYCLRVDGDVIDGGAVGLAQWLKAERGIFSAPRYIQKPAFRCEVFAKQRTFGNSRFPFTHASPEALDYSAEKFPGTFEGLEKVLVLPWNEAYTDAHIDYIAEAVHTAVAALTR
nr:DegT/DnrJ/EryC1/StrS family aminotransferase [Nodosilinea sp. TSF1-S3]MDF0367023.1 DegT/DnrJ/EryC1/StrS family aminotransferase [Nodosilinea sp. TSF1-S3]